MLALHARRSAPSIAAWYAAVGSRGLGVVLTGTDLYRDIEVDAQAQHSIACAQCLVVLQDKAPDTLHPELRAKTRVIYQSTQMREPLVKAHHELSVVVVGHLREVKSPATVFEAARLLRGRADVRITHIGEAGEPGFAQLARQAELDSPCYRWLAGLPHDATLDAISSADVLVHPSAMEGGAHVVMEAICSGTPVLASRIPGNVGMLGEGYAGYFEHGDAQGLARLLQACRDGQQSPGPDSLLDVLRMQCARRAFLFDPAAERAALLRLVAELQPA